MPVSLADLLTHLRQYRDAADNIFSGQVVTQEDCRTYFLQLLLNTTKIYLDFLLVLHALPYLYASSNRGLETALIGSDSEREMAHRNRYRSALERVPFATFRPSDLAKLTFKWMLDDYVDSLGLHVPEIYEETFRLEIAIERLGVGLVASDLVDFELSFRHLIENHATFLLPVLQDLATEQNWRDAED